MNKMAGYGHQQVDSGPSCSPVGAVAFARPTGSCEAASTSHHWEGSGPEADQPPKSSHSTWGGEEVHKPRVSVGGAEGLTPGQPEEAQKGRKQSSQDRKRWTSRWNKSQETSGKW